MSSPQNIVESLYTSLTGLSDLATALGLDADGNPRIYYTGTGPQNLNQPYVTYNVLQDPVARNFDDSITYGADVHFDIWTPRAGGTAAATAAGTLEEYLFQLDRTVLSVSGLDRGVLLFTNRGVPEVEEDAVRVSSDARITGTGGTAITMSQVYVASARVAGTPLLADDTDEHLTGEHLIPSRLLTPGTNIRVDAFGLFSGAGGASTYKFYLMVGGTSGTPQNGSIMLVNTPGYNPAVLDFIQMSFDMTVFTAGATGTIYGKGTLVCGVNEAIVTSFYSDVGGIGQTFDMTADLPVKWRSVWAAPDSATTLNPLGMTVTVTPPGATITLP